MTTVDFGRNASMSGLPSLEQMGSRLTDEVELITIANLVGSQQWPNPGVALPLADSHQEVHRYPGDFRGIVAALDIAPGLDGDVGDNDGQQLRVVSEDDAPALDIAEAIANDPTLSRSERVQAEQDLRNLRAGSFVVFAALGDLGGGATKTGFADLVAVDVLTGPVSAYGMEMTSSLVVSARAPDNQSLSLKCGVPYELGTTGLRRVMMQDGSFNWANVLSFPGAIQAAISSSPELSRQPVDRVIADICLRVYELLSVHSDDSPRTGTDIDILARAHMENTQDGLVFWETAYAAGRRLVESMKEISRAKARKSTRRGNHTDVDTAVPLLSDEMWKAIEGDPSLSTELHKMIDTVSEAATEDTMVRMAKMHTTKIDEWYQDEFQNSRLAKGAKNEELAMMQQMIAIARSNPVRLVIKSVGDNSAEFDKSLTEFVTECASSPDGALRSLATAAGKMLAVRRKHFPPDANSGGSSGGLVVTTIPSGAVPGGRPYTAVQNKINVRVDPPLLEPASVSGGQGATTFGPDFAIDPKIEGTGFPSMDWVSDGGAPGISGVVCSVAWKPTEEQNRSFPPMEISGVDPKDLPLRYVVINVGLAPNMLANAIKRLGSDIRGASLRQLLENGMSGRYTLLRGDERTETLSGIEGNEAVRTSALRRIGSVGPGQTMQVYRRETPAPFTNDMIDVTVVPTAASVTQRSRFRFSGVRGRGQEMKPSSNNGKGHIGTFVSDSDTLRVSGPRMSGEDSFVVVRPR